MNRNRFNPQIWEQPRPVHPIPPFVNQGPNFFHPPHQNFQNAQNIFGRNNNFPPLQNPHDQLPSGINTGNPPPNFRKYINNRRPGPACSRNNNFQRWERKKTNYFKIWFKVVSISAINSGRRTTGARILTTIATVNSRLSLSRALVVLTITITIGSHQIQF